MGDSLKRTPLYHWHVKKGARIVPFAGWEMPVQYTGILEEHKAVRDRAGLFDVSHMGEILVKGKEARQFLDYLLPGKLSKLTLNRVLYSPMCKEHGGVIDDLMVYALGEEEFLLCVNASNTDRDFEWIQEKSKRFNTDVRNVSDEYFLLALQGPAWRAIAEKVLPGHLFPDRFSVNEVSYQGSSLMISRTGYTGEDGIEIYGPPALAESLADQLWEAGEPEGLKLAGLGSRDSLRLEAGLPLYGHELSEEMTPLESGLNWTVDWKKADFIGREALHAQKQQGVSRKVAYFVTGDRRIARQGTPVLRAADPAGEAVGEVLSGTLSPVLNQPIGSALITVDCAKEPLIVSLRGHSIPLSFRKPPLHLSI